jgi:hypothetical protein
LTVIRLIEYRCRETVSILKVLLSLAMQGKLRGLAVFYRTAEGDEQTVLTGYYKANPSRAAGASLSMSLKLMRANGEID